METPTPTHTHIHIHTCTQAHIHLILFRSWFVFDNTGVARTIQRLWNDNDKTSMFFCLPWLFFQCLHFLPSLSTAELFLLTSGLVSAEVKQNVRGKTGRSTWLTETVLTWENLNILRPASMGLLGNSARPSTAAE